MHTRRQFIDIHSHLNDLRYDADMSEVLTRMREQGVSAIVVGTDREMSKRALSCAEQYPDCIIGATIGQHPTDKHKELFDESWYRQYAREPKVIGIGECGLDYYWPTHPQSRNDFGNIDDEKKRQRALFAQHIALAEAVNKPLMIHGRPTPQTMDAYEEILDMLHGHSVHGNVHFFVGDTSIARRFLDLGFSISFTGVLTFTHDYDEVVRYIPLERIMSETDSPYVAPVPYRGQRNEPAFVLEVVRAIARIRGKDEEAIATALHENALRMFHPKRLS